MRECGHVSQQIFCVSKYTKEIKVEPCPGAVPGEKHTLLYVILHRDCLDRGYIIVGRGGGFVIYNYETTNTNPDLHGDIQTVSETG